MPWFLIFTVNTAHLGIPVTVVLVLTAGVEDAGDFKTKYACWCRSGSVPFWIFIVTLCAILLVSLHKKILSRWSEHHRIYIYQLIKNTRRLYK